MFDHKRFWAAVDSTCVARSLSYKEAAELAGVSASTMTRLSQGKKPDIDTFAALVSWMGWSADEFLSIEPVWDVEDRIKKSVMDDPCLNESSKQFMLELINLGRKHADNFDPKQAAVWGGGPPSVPPQIPDYPETVRDVHPDRDVVRAMWHWGKGATSWDLQCQHVVSTGRFNGNIPMSMRFHVVKTGDYAIVSCATYRCSPTSRWEEGVSKDEKVRFRCRAVYENNTFGAWSEWTDPI